MKPKGQGEPAGDSIGATGESTPPGAAGTATLTAPPGAPNEAQLAAARGEGAQQAEARERARCTAILSLATKHSLDDETREQLLSSGASIERAHEVVLDKIHERTTRPAATAALSVGAESRDHVIAGAEGAILLSLGYRELDAAIAKQREEKARPFRGLTMVELARKFLEVTGKRTEGLSRSEVCRLAIGMHGTSDFPKIFANVQNKFLQEGYDAAPSSFEMLARVRSAKDFKTIATNHAGLGSRLAEMQEGAPVTYGTITEGGETYAVKRYGKGLTFSIEAMLNDDLDALSAIPRNFGVQTRVLTNRLAWALPIANAAMADGVVIFHATHANLITDSLDDATALKNARIKLRLQTEPDGSVLNLSPAWLIVPPTLETLGRQLVSSEFNPSDQSKINTFKGLGIIVEQELESASGGSAAKWYMTCAKEMIPAFEVAYLEGKKVPTIDSQTDFDSDALKTKATFVVGLCVPNHRAWVHSNATT